MPALEDVHDKAGTADFVADLVAGDDAARVALVTQWGPTVLRWCARLGGAGVDAEDAAHDVFERVMAHVHTLRAPDAFPSWLFHTTRRVIGHHRRRAWLRRWVPGLVPDVPDPAGGPGRRAELSDVGRRVQASLDALDPTLREVLVLCEIEDRDGPEVATLLDVPLGTVKSRLRRARAAFEQQARRRGLGPEDLVGADG